ncbi:uncharacterized protein LOC131253112 [Magnolia sinica]|uniref:uncharacterized protein LOC131253112 n=1 Tax=Magnolia sinica TaxID=86752 RepID=UPI00265A2607|nr:uncharacterized protein LOC131253112 [Magnolia sinica]
MQRQLSLLGHVLKSNGSRFPRPNQGFLPPLRQLPRNLSTDGGTESKEPSFDPFLQSPTKGLIYGRLTGIGKNTLKTDVIHFFEGCGLTMQDIKVDYNRTYASFGMILQFSSWTVFDTATRLITRKGRLYRLEKVDRGQWDLLKFYDGKVVLLQGVPRNALPEDIERFLSGCNFDASSIQIIVRPGFPDPSRFALVHFPSQIEAMNAFRVKNRSFCLNNPILMRVLQ